MVYFYHTYKQLKRKRKHNRALVAIAFIAIYFIILILGFMNEKYTVFIDYFLVIQGILALKRPFLIANAGAVAESDRKLSLLMTLWRIASV